MTDFTLNDTERAALLLGFCAAILMRLRLQPEAAAGDHRICHHSPGLRARDHNILELIGQGCSNKEIGRELGISAETVKFHVRQLFRKLGVEKRAQAVARAQELGVLHGPGRPRLGMNVAVAAVSGDRAVL